VTRVEHAAPGGPRSETVPAGRDLDFSVRFDVTLNVLPGLRSAVPAGYVRGPMAMKPPKRSRRPRTEWHPPFGALLEERRPRWITVALEVVLQRQSQRVDVMLLRRVRGRHDPDDQGRVLRSLWKHVSHVGLLEFKSTSRLFARGDLYRLVALGWHWLSRNPKRSPDDVVLLLVVPALTRRLHDELAPCDATLTTAEPGYHLATVRGGMRLVIAELDVVAESERDDYLRVFSHHPIQTEAVVDWVREHTDLPEDAVLSPEEVAKNEPMLIKLANSIPLRIRLKGVKPAEVLAELSPEQRLAGLQPEQRLAGLAPEQAVLALPDEILRNLAPSYLATLPADVQATVRARLAR